MRRALSALAISSLALLLTAARCSDDDDDMKLGTYPEIDSDAEPVSTPTDAASDAGDGTAPKGAEAKGPEDDLFTDPLDEKSGAPKVDDATILDDAQTFEPSSTDGPGLPSATGPDGESLPQVPGPDADMSGSDPGFDGGT